MDILKNQTLATHTTMRLGGNASCMVECHTEDDLREAVQYAQANTLRIMVLGSGSNIVFGDAGFDGLVILNEIIGVTVDATTGKVSAKSGTNWDEFVKTCVENNLAGVEALSLIPGTVGASPVNNIGAYGQEVKDTITHVRAFDTTTLQYIELANADCQFNYRNSIFKSTAYGRYIITEVFFQLTPASDTYIAPHYASLQTALQNQGITQPTIHNVRDIVIAIRQAKLPDPAVLPNTGSFFKNPIVSQEKCDELLQKYPAMPYFAHKQGIKLAAGWLIDTAGLKGYAQDGMRVYDKQALVLVNDGTRSFQSLLNMKNHIQQTVFDTFGVTLEPEPEIIT
jgi:UDP-N-acetylmuramate dehydrogenase